MAEWPRLVHSFTCVGQLGSFQLRVNWEKLLLFLVGERRVMAESAW